MSAFEKTLNSIKPENDLAGHFKIGLQNIDTLRIAKRELELEIIKQKDAKKNKAKYLQKNINLTFAPKSKQICRSAS